MVRSFRLDVFFLPNIFFSSFFLLFLLHNTWIISTENKTGNLIQLIIWLSIPFFRSLLGQERKGALPFCLMLATFFLLRLLLFRIKFLFCSYSISTSFFLFSSHTHTFSLLCLSSFSLSSFCSRFLSNSGYTPARHICVFLLLPQFF